MSIKKKTNFIIALFIILGILFLVSVIWPTFKEIKTNSKNLVTQKENLAMLAGKIENLDTLENIYQEFELKLTEIDNLFVNAELPIDFIGFLEATAQDHQGEISISANPFRKEERDPWNSLAFQVTVVSSFADFLKILEKVELSPYLIEIQDLNIGQAQDVNNIRGIVSLKVFTK